MNGDLAGPTPVRCPCPAPLWARRRQQRAGGFLGIVSRCSATSLHHERRRGIAAHSSFTRNDVNTNKRVGREGGEAAAPGEALLAAASDTPAPELGQGPARRLTAQSESVAAPRLTGPEFVCTKSVREGEREAGAQRHRRRRARPSGRETGKRARALFSLPLSRGS